MKHSKICPTKLRTITLQRHRLVARAGNYSDAALVSNHRFDCESKKLAKSANQYHSISNEQERLNFLGRIMESSLSPY